MRGFFEVCSELCGRLTSIAAGKMSVDVTIKKISRRNITSVIDDIENVSRVWKFFFRATMLVGYKVNYYCALRFDGSAAAYAGSLRRSMNSIVLASMEFMIRLTRDTRKL